MGILVAHWLAYVRFSDVLQVKEAADVRGGWWYVTGRAPHGNHVTETSKCLEMERTQLSTYGIC